MSGSGDIIVLPSFCVLECILRARESKEIFGLTLILLIRETDLWFIKAAQWGITGKVGRKIFEQKGTKNY